MRKVRQNIMTVDGKVLHSGSARTPRALLKDLLNQAASRKEILDLGRADLSGMNLSGLDFAGKAQLTDACLKDCDLSAADFTGCPMRGCNLSGVKAPGANFSFADMMGANMDGGAFEGASFMMTILVEGSLNGADFTKADMKDTNLSHSRGLRTVFSRALLRGAFLNYAHLHYPDFRGAQLLDGRILTRSDDNMPAALRGVLDRHDALRSVDATISRGRYDDKTVISKAAYAPVVTDRRLSRTLDAGGFVSMALLSGMALDPVIDVVKEHLGVHGHETAGAIIALSGAYVMKEMCDDRMKDFIQDNFSRGYAGFNRLFRDSKAAMRNLVDVVFLVGKSETLLPVKMALKARSNDAARKGWWGRFSAFVSQKSGEILVCDRRHLGLALQTVCDYRDRILPRTHDVTLMRCDGVHHVRAHVGPCTVNFHPDGSVSGVWSHGRSAPMMTARFDVDGRLLKVEDDAGNEVHPAQAGLDKTTTADQMVALFEQGLLADHALENVVRYSPDTHRLLGGQDGAILVRRRRHYLLDNTLGPAAVLGDGTQYFLKDGDYLSTEKFEIRSRRREKRRAVTLAAAARDASKVAAREPVMLTDAVEDAGANEPEALKAPGMA